MTEREDGKNPAGEKPWICPKAKELSCEKSCGCEHTEPHKEIVGFAGCKNGDKVVCAKGHRLICIPFQPEDFQKVEPEGKGEVVIEKLRRHFKWNNYSDGVIDLVIGELVDWKDKSVSKERERTQSIISEAVGKKEKETLDMVIRNIEGTIPVIDYETWQSYRDDLVAIFTRMKTVDKP